MSRSKLLQSIVLLLLTLFITQHSFGQDRVISGKIIDSSGNGVAGATVTAKGSSKGTQTATDGTFSLSVPSSVTALSVSSIGFTTQEVSISGKSSITVSLQGRASSLNEVVVIGYGTRLKKDLTG